MTKVMEKTINVPLAIRMRGLEIKLECAKGYLRFCKRMFPFSGEWVAATLRVIELEWAIEDLKRHLPYETLT